MPFLIAISKEESRARQNVIKPRKANEIEIIEPTDLELGDPRQAEEES